MAYKIDFEKRALADFEKLDRVIKKQIQKYIDKIEARENPRTLGEQLHDNLSALWKYRVGNYRLIAHIEDDRLIVLMLAVSHRKDVYKIVKKRFAARQSSENTQ